MADRDWRSWERRWRASPHDLELLERAVAARQRAGLPVPEPMRRARVLPARTLPPPPAAFPVLVELSDGDLRAAGRAHPDGSGLRLPPCRAWWAALDGLPLEALEGVLEHLAAVGAHGLRIDGSQLEPLLARRADLGWLTHLRVVRGAVADEAAWPPLGELAALTHLHVDGWPLDDGSPRLGPALLGSLPPDLVRLELERAGTNDAALQALAHHPHLTAVRIPAQWVSSAGLRALARAAPELTELDLSRGPELADVSLAALPRGLTRLSLGLCLRLSGAGLQHLSALESLEHLDLSGNPDLAPRDLAVLERLPRLTSLDLGRCASLDAGVLPLLAGLPGLTDLSLRRCRRVAARGLTPLRRLTALVRLDLAVVDDVDDADLSLLARLPELTALNLGAARAVTDAGLVALAGAPSLRRLNLGATDHPTPAGLRSLAEAGRLTWLQLAVAGWVDDAALAALAPLERLTHLDLRYCARVTDQGAAHLAALPALAELDLKETALTDRGLAALTAAPALETLALDGCTGVSDGGLDDLGRMESLRRLALRSTGVDDAGRRALRRRLPQCLIDATPA